MNKIFLIFIALGVLIGGAEITYAKKFKSQPTKRPDIYFKESNSSWRIEYKENSDILIQFLRCPYNFNDKTCTPMMEGTISSPTLRAEIKRLKQTPANEKQYAIILELLDNMLATVPSNFDEASVLDVFQPIVTKLCDGPAPDADYSCKWIGVKTE